MRLFSQPFDGQLGEVLLEGLNSSEFHRLNIVVAFAKNSGVLRLREAMERFRDQGGEIHLYVGVDMNATSYEALVNLLPVSTSLRVVHDENGQTFHTKLFNFVGSDKSVLVVGSHNLTGGGLWTSYESSIHLTLDLGNDDQLQMQRSVDEYLTQLSSLDNTVKVIEGEDTIKALLLSSYVEREVKTQVRRRRASAEVERRQTLFGRGERARLPALPKSASSRSVVLPQPSPADPRVTPLSMFTQVERTDDATLWLETRKMTGGSRNILDLSKTSLLRSGDVAGTSYAHEDTSFMRGAVEFFGVDPEDTDREKEIVVNFEGTDYSGNTIKFPEGAHANGTWRVQIKGVSDSGQKITSVFKGLSDEGFFLPEKIVTFTRINPDYYFLSVFSERDLPEFLEASTVTAYNGRIESARLLGIL